MESIQLLRTYGNQVKSGNEYNFTSLFKNKTNWYVGNGELGEFFAQYCETLQDAIENNINDEQNILEDSDDGIEHKDKTSRAIYGIVQKATPNIPIVVDFNMKFDSLPEEPYSEEFIFEALRIIQSTIDDLYSIDRSDEEAMSLLCAVSEWTIPAVISRGTIHNSKKRYMYRLRFHFPFIRVSAKSLTKLRKMLISEIRSNPPRFTRSHPIGDWGEILKVFTTEGIPLFGSSEKKEYPPLSHVGIYDDIIDMDTSGEIDSIPIGEVFDVSQHSWGQTQLVDSEIFDNLDKTELLPYFLSNEYILRTTAERDMVVVESDYEEEGAAYEYNKGNNTSREKSQFDIATELIDLVSHKRFTKRITWMDIGRALHNASGGSDEGLFMWTSYTQRALKHCKGKTPDFLEGDVSDLCAEEYDSFDIEGPITVKTLAWYAMEDSPKKYKVWHDNWSGPYRERALDLTDSSIAKALYCHIWLTFCCTDMRSREFWNFRNHNWKLNPCGYKIRLYISNEFRRTFEDDRTKLSQQASRSNDESFKRRATDTIDILNKLIKKLGMVASKNNFMTELMSLLFVERFNEFRDDNGNLTGCPNGTFEVDYDNRTIDFRNGKPEDYLTKQLGVRYDDRLSLEHPKVVELMEYLKKWQTQKETLHWNLKMWGSFLIEGNLDKKLPFYLGDKNNSKSTIVKLLMKTLGSYGVKFPTTGLTRGYSDSGAANPAWVRLSGPRGAFGDEPSPKEKLKPETSKLVSGNDPFYARGLFKDGGDLKATATVVTSANRIPQFENPDDACYERLVAVPCGSTWLPKDRLPKDKKECEEKRLFPMDKDFVNRVAKFGPAMLWLMVHYFPTWCEEGLEVLPPEIKEATDAYWAENDIYLIYTTDRIVQSDENDSITVSQLFQDFEVWFEKYNRNNECPDRPTVKYHFGLRWGKPKDDTWWGVSFKDSDEDSENAGGRRRMGNKKGMMKGKRERININDQFDEEFMNDAAESDEETTTKKSGHKKIPKIRNPKEYVEDMVVPAADLSALKGKKATMKHGRIAYVSDDDIMATETEGGITIGG